MLASLGSAGFDTYMVVNDLLMQITPLQDRLVPLNLYGRLDKRQLKTLDETMTSSKNILIFPAGMVSKLEGFRIRDREWNPFFLRKAQKYKRDIVPIFFEAKNSYFFYLLAWFRKQFRLKVNLEMLLLPREMFHNKNKEFNIFIRKPIPWQTLETPASSLITSKAKNKLANWIRDNCVYSK